MIRLPGENLIIIFFLYSPLHFVELMPFANLDIETSNKDMSQTITASSLRFGQLKENDYIDYLMNKGW